MNNTNEVKVVSWTNIAADQRHDIDYLNAQVKAYTDNIAGYVADKSYIAITNQLFKLNKLNLKKDIAAKKATDRAIAQAQRTDEKRAKEVEKISEKISAKIGKLTAIQERKDVTEKKVQSIEEQMDEIIDTHSLFQMGIGKLYWYIKENDGQYYTVQPDALKGRFPILNEFIKQEVGTPNYDSYKEFLSRMVERERIIYTVTEDWTSKTGSGVLNKLERRFAAPAADGTTDYHWIVDAVFRSLAGDDTGAATSLERTIWSKYLYPENFMNPHPFFNDDGETGKNFFVSKFLKPLFGGQINENVNIESITGKFNSESVGKAIVFINETVKESHSAEKLKALLGSPTLTVEHKYERPYQTPNTAMVIGSSNTTGGAVLLSGSKTDRRFSIYSSKTNLAQVVLSYLVAHAEMDLGGNPFTVNTALTKVTEWIKQVGDPLLNDVSSIGKWINAMATKHGNVRNVEAFHGQDYADLLDRQRGAWLDIVQKVFEEPTFEMIRNPLLRELVVACNSGERIPGKKTMKDRIEKMIADLGLDIEYDGRFNCQHAGNYTSVTVWRKRSCKGGASTASTDAQYGHMNAYDKWIWDFVE